jgi:hydroxyacylglutathione hydrolase
MRIVTVPCLRDNYAYLVISASGLAAVVDPGEAAPVLAEIARQGVQLRQVWATHHHADHVGGVPALRAALPALEVVAHAIDAPRIGPVEHAVQDGARLALGELEVEVLHNPGHTLGACTFLVGGAAFTGDTLFGAGCGRLFEGDAAMLHASLTRLAALPPSTAVHVGHEYTLGNLAFAAQAWPDNPAIATRHAAASALRAAGRPTTPSTIADERASNPFLACDMPAVIAAVSAHAGTALSAGAPTFAALRAWKDSFRG